MLSKEGSLPAASVSTVEAQRVLEDSIDRGALPHRLRVGGFNLGCAVIAPCETSGEIEVAPDDEAVQIMTVSPQQPNAALDLPYQPSLSMFQQRSNPIHTANATDVINRHFSSSITGGLAGGSSVLEMLTSLPGIAAATSMNSSATTVSTTCESADVDALRLGSWNVRHRRNPSRRVPGASSPVAAEGYVTLPAHGQVPSARPVYHHSLVAKAREPSPASRHRLSCTGFGDGSLVSEVDDPGSGRSLLPRAECPPLFDDGKSMEAYFAGDHNSSLMTSAAPTLLSHASRQALLSPHASSGRESTASDRRRSEPTPAEAVVHLRQQQSATVLHLNLPKFRL